jgi:two-component system sensor histidine kinase GlrK
VIRSLYWKLISGFGLIILALVAINGFVVFRLHEVRSILRSMIAVDVHLIDLARSLRASLAEEEQSSQKFLVTRDSLYASLLRDHASRTAELLDAMMGLASDRPVRNALRRIRRGHEGLFLAITDPSPLHSLPSEVIISDSMAAYVAVAEGIQRDVQHSVFGAVAGVEETTDRALDVALILSLISLVATVATALFITRSISRPLHLLEQGTQQVAQGDFRAIPVVTRDEIGRLAVAFNAMTARLGKIDELKADMLHHISHELRVPLQSVMAAYYLLSEQHRGALNEEQLRLLGLIRDNVDRIARFSNQFLDLAKIEAGAMEFSLAPVAVSELLKPLMDNMYVLAQRRNIALSVEGNEVPAVLGDAEKLGEVLTNLIGNAIKYTRSGGSVAVRYGRGGAGVRISVQDTGIGIASVDLPHIFDKFYRARDAGRTVGGSGVGLALVKAVVEGHHGKISVVSEKGKGSTFTVELPAAAALDLQSALGIQAGKP